jgi:rare lipoprotein A
MVFLDGLLIDLSIHFAQWLIGQTFFCNPCATLLVLLNPFIIQPLRVSVKFEAFVSPAKPQAHPAKCDSHHFNLLFVHTPANLLMPRSRLLLVSLFLLILLGLIIPIYAFAPRRAHDGEILHGKASWYGSEQGHHTASGERFNENDFTAANRHLPFGSIIRVTNENNGLSVQVRINDRGPWTGGRILDVSSAAADVLQMKRAGIVPVKIEVLQLGSPGRANNG